MLTPFQLGFYAELAGESYQGQNPWPFNRRGFLNPNFTYEKNYYAQWRDGAYAAFEWLNNPFETDETFYM